MNEIRQNLLDFYEQRSTSPISRAELLNLQKKKKKYTELTVRTLSEIVPIECRHLRQLGGKSCASILLSFAKTRTVSSAFYLRTVVKAGLSGRGIDARNLHSLQSG